MVGGSKKFLVLLWHLLPMPRLFPEMLKFDKASGGLESNLLLKRSKGVVKIGLLSAFFSWILVSPGREVPPPHPRVSVLALNHCPGKLFSLISGWNFP